MNTTCRIDKSELIEVMDFGDIYFSDFVDNATDGFKSPLKVGIGRYSGLVQLFDAPDPEKMYRKYWYRSGINESMVRDLKDITDSIKKYITVESGDTVLDIACNDGTLLRNWSDGIKKIGIDPAKNLQEFRKDIDASFVEDFFSANNYWSVAKEKAKVITSIAMFYDLPDPKWFVNEVKNCLHENGLWVLQLSYTPLMLEQNAFDNVCHEHIEYYTLTVMNNLLRSCGLKIVDVELNDVNSGSFRIYVAHNDNKKFRLSTHAQIMGEYRVKSLLTHESYIGVDKVDTYKNFFTRVEQEKNKTIQLLNDLKKSGKSVIGIGASTKGNTLLQYYGIDSNLISHIGERTKEKIGKVTVGSGIPIISEEEMRNRKPDYLFVFPWHFVNAFMEREKELLNNGTKLIVPLPNLIIGE